MYADVDPQAVAPSSVAGGRAMNRLLAQRACLLLVSCVCLLAAVAL